MLAASARAAPAAALPALTPRRTAPRSMKFMKKLGLKKPEWLPDFGKPKEFSGSLKQSAELKFPEIPASKMYATLSPFDAPYIAKGGIAEVTECSGNTVGSLRTIKAGPAEFEERLVLLDEEKMAFAYEILDCSKTPFPLSTYGSKCYVMQDGEGCSVTWTGWYDLVEGTADDAVPDFTGLYTGFINSAAEGL